MDNHTDVMAKYNVIYKTPSDDIVESRHSDKEYAEERRDFCRKLLHKLNVHSVDVTVESL
ncbi:hypothetical protein CYXG_00051 [Synechococcus phage S-SSM4]|uniref:Uncharacterized protein n=1 Tax=Synechococcus phage S-SSM4 TaxID=536466 RepID=M1T264_9CAUD|nr:hypothetical protein CYXG_00051 [Synechococcus phage S-SSM4]AGG54115.1 hypothetical protein CYXG_00051 [Synechococcus phage S-SSM4]